MPGFNLFFIFYWFCLCLRTPSCCFPFSLAFFLLNIKMPWFFILFFIYFLLILLLSEDPQLLLFSFFFLFFFWRLRLLYCNVFFPSITFIWFTFIPLSLFICAFKPHPHHHHHHFGILSLSLCPSLHPSPLHLSYRRMCLLKFSLTFSPLFTACLHFLSPLLPLLVSLIAIYSASGREWKLQRN